MQTIEQTQHIQTEVSCHQTFHGKTTDSSTANNNLTMPHFNYLYVLSLPGITLLTDVGWFPTTWKPIDIASSVCSNITVFSAAGNKQHIKGVVQAELHLLNINIIYS